jgi:hypothetical protein
MTRRCLEASRTLNWEHEEHALRGVFADLLGSRAAPVPPVELPAAGADDAVPEITTAPRSSELVR